MKIFQKGFNFSQDGPGNRLVYHVAGCNMHCPWCSNPEGMHTNPKTEEYTLDKIICEAQSCRPMFFGGGGVTFTGGEATLNYEELADALRELRAQGIHTAIETNGTCEKLFEILEHVDYLIMDFKHYDEQTLWDFTGMGCKAIKENYGKICAAKRQCHIRIPLINGFNTDNPEEFASYLSGFDTQNVVFEFLKYHEYGKGKWQTEYKIKDGFVSEQKLDEFKKAFKESGLKYIET